MILMEHRQGRFYPRVHCDYCGDLIARGADGNMEWAQADREGITDSIKFVHKRCSRALEAEAKQEGETWMTLPLTLMPIYLLTNLDIEYAAAVALATHLGQF